MSKSTISRAVTSLTPLLGQVLEGRVSTADEFDDTVQYVVDGTLLPLLVMGRTPGVVLRQRFLVNLDSTAPRIVPEPGTVSFPYKVKETRFERARYRLRTRVFDRHVPPAVAPLVLA